MHLAEFIGKFHDLRSSTRIVVRIGEDLFDIERVKLRIPSNGRELEAIIDVVDIPYAQTRTK